MAAFGSLFNTAQAPGPMRSWFDDNAPGGIIATNSQGVDGSGYQGGSVPPGYTGPPGSQGGAIPPGYVWTPNTSPTNDTPGYGGGYGPGPGMTGQAGGDPQAFFNSLFPGDTLSPDMLTQHEADLQAHGISLVRNAAGVPGKIKLPNGDIVDVIQGAGAGVNKKQWLAPTPGGGSGGSSGGGMGGFGSLNFNSPYQNFQAPSLEDARNSPGYQFALEQGMKGIQNSAAAHGTLLTGGTLKALQGYGTGLADSTYGNVFSRAFQTNQANFGNDLQTNQAKYGNLYGLAALGKPS